MSATDGDALVLFDISKVISLTATTQRETNGHHSAVAQAFGKRLNEKANKYANEAAQRNGLLVPFVVDAHGSFCPRDQVRKHHPQLDSTPTLRHLFGTTAKAPTRGQISLSVEEGFLRRLAQRTADTTTGGLGAFDRTLTTQQATGMYLNQLYQRVAYSAIKGAAQSTILSLARHYKTLT